MKKQLVYRKGDPIKVEFYGITLYGRVIRVQGDLVYYRSDIGQTFTVDISEVQPCDPEEIYF
jgi:hypothetical protein